MKTRVGRMAKEGAINWEFLLRLCQSGSTEQELHKSDLIWSMWLEQESFQLDCVLSITTYTVSCASTFVGSSFGDGVSSLVRVEQNSTLVGFVNRWILLTKYIEQGEGLEGSQASKQNWSSTELQQAILAFRASSKKDALFFLFLTFLPVYYRRFYTL